MRTRQEYYQIVSTHSRPKAAAVSFTACLNFGEFQHTAARRRLVDKVITFANTLVSTHSRPKAAERGEAAFQVAVIVSTHSRPKAAERGEAAFQVAVIVSTHSRPKAAAVLYNAQSL